MTRFLVASGVALLIGALTIPLLHDGWVEFVEDSAGEAQWKWLLWGEIGLPPGWRRVDPDASREAVAWARDVTPVGDGVYTVDGWVERLDDRGVRACRACTWRLWRESYDVWHLTRISIHGESPIEMDEIDGPTGKAASLWCERLDRALGRRDSIP